MLVIVMNSRLTFLVFIIGDLLNFTAMTVAGSFVYLKGVVLDQVTFFVHVTHRPIRQLTIVDDAAQGLWAISEGARMNTKYIVKQYCQ